MTTESETEGGRFHLDLVGSARIAWRFGADYYRSEQDADRTVSRRDNGRLVFDDVVWPEVVIEDLGSYGQLRWSGDGSEVGATVRLDLVDASAGRPSAFFLANTAGELAQEEINLSAAVSGRFSLAEGWTLTAGIGRAVRTATALERYSDRFPSTKFQLPAEFLGDPELDPEAALEIDEDFADHLNAKNPFTGQRILERGRSVHLTVRWAL